MVQPDYQLPARMRLKEQAIPHHDLRGRRVLDIGTDFGYWAARAANEGAAYVLGLDRNRPVRGHGHVDLINRNRTAFRHLKNVEFEHTEVGRQFRDFGKFDVVYLFSLYHHIYECTGGDHPSIWYWLWRHCNPGAMLIWENPVNTLDNVAERNISPQYHGGYNRLEILSTASRYFDVGFHGPALHEPEREVWVCRPRANYTMQTSYGGFMMHGAGGASKAFEYKAGRRCSEIEEILGVRPFPGSLNVKLTSAFDWNSSYFRVKILDVVNRKEGIDSEWRHRWARLYPVTVEGIDAYAFRFEGEVYPANFVELISATRLRSEIKGEAVGIIQCRALN